jgi:hypothetical protein
MRLGDAPIATTRSNLVYVVTGWSPTISDATATKIAGFSTLPIGWDYGAGGPMAYSTINLAWRINTFLRQLGFSDIDAFPGADGEISIGVISGEHYVEIIVEPDETMAIAYDFQGKQESYIPGIRYPQAELTLKALAERIWSTHAYFTQISSTRGAIALRAWPSRTRLVTAAYRSSIVNVSGRMETKFAITQENIMQAKLESRQFTGNSMIPYFQIPVE